MLKGGCSPAAYLPRLQGSMLSGHVHAVRHACVNDRMSRLLPHGCCSIPMSQASSVVLDRRIIYSMTGLSRFEQMLAQHT